MEKRNEQNIMDMGFILNTHANLKDNNMDMGFTLNPMPT